MNDENRLIYQLQPEDEGKRLERILFRRFHLSRKLLQKIKMGQNVWLDDKFVYLNTTGRAGQTLVVNLLQEEDSTLSGEDLALDILYEDSLFLAVNKPPGQVVHPTPLHRCGTLANAVVGYWERKGEFRPFRPVSRIDRNTSGIVMVAKSRYSHQQLAHLSATNLVEKKYLGLVEGSFPLKEGVLDYPIRVQPGSKIVREVHPEGRTAKTIYKTLQIFANYTLMEFTLVTGRTHQIRIHCQHAGYPLLGDDLYRGKMDCIARQALHCHSYTFIHPLTGKDIAIEAPLPEDMQSLIV